MTQESLDRANRIDFPVFVKSLVPKELPARVYRDAKDLQATCAGLPGTTQLLVSEVLDLTAELRCFALDGEILDCAAYEGSAETSSAAAFAAEVLRNTRLPRTVVIDLGVRRDGALVVIEFNAAWGAGLNGCDASKIVPAIEAASRAAKLTSTDEQAG